MLFFFKNHDINIVLEEDAVDSIIEQMLRSSHTVDDIYDKLSKDFQHGLKLVLEKTGKNRFFISRKAIEDPESYLNDLIKDEINKNTLAD